ncbi:MAG: hypothetical protein QME60_03850 [Verrucomicrobiota bacterium]|nr:hypothetical protein [Verrucomicrobiota bacterium]
MNWLKDLCRRSMIGAPPALLALGWAAIWLLWPRGQLPPDRIRARSATHIRFAGVREGFNRAAIASDVAVISSSASRRIEDQDDLAILLYKPAGGELVPRAGLGERLAIPCPAPACLALALAAGPRGIRVEERTGGSIPAAFALPAAKPAELALELAPSLLTRGFRLPEAPADLPKSGATSWQAVFQVECGADGRVEHVFREVGTGNATLDASLAKWLDRGDLTAGEGACDGRIVVNFGAP